MEVLAPATPSTSQKMLSSCLLDTQGLCPIASGILTLQHAKVTGHATDHRLCRIGLKCQGASAIRLRSHTMFAPAREHEHGTEAGLGHEPFQIVTAFPISVGNQRRERRLGVPAFFHSPRGQPAENHLGPKPLKIATRRRTQSTSMQLSGLRYVYGRCSH